MKYNFIHYLVLTPFESSLTQLDWETVAAQDYPIHVLYCKELKCILFHSDNQHIDCAEEIKNICTLLTKLAIEVYIEQQIIIMGTNENEYCEQDVLRHINH